MPVNDLQQFLLDVHGHMSGHTDQPPTQAHVHKALQRRFNGALRRVQQLDDAYTVLCGANEVRLLTHSLLTHTIDTTKRSRCHLSIIRGDLIWSTVAFQRWPSTRAARITVCACGTISASRQGCVAPVTRANAYCGELTTPFASCQCQITALRSKRVTRRTLTWVCARCDSSLALWTRIHVTLSSDLRIMVQWAHLIMAASTSCGATVFRGWRW